MKMSRNGIELLKRFEGLELEAYQDIAGVWTIGYGHTGPDVKPGMRISEREAEDLLRRDLKSREDAVERLTNVSINQNEFDALVSFVYNVGIEAYRGSTARRRLNRGDRLGAAEALTWWNKATVGGVLRPVTGLTRRRAAERALFLTPVNPPLVKNPEELEENSRVTPVEDPPRRGGLGESRTIQGATVAGGAGVAASNMGKNDAEELDAMETRIENGDELILDGESPGDSNDEVTADDREDEMDDTNVPVGADDTNETGDDTTDTADPPNDTGEPDTTDTDDASDSADAPDGTDDSSDASEDVDIVITDPIPDAGETTESIELGEERPSKHEKHAADAQIQFALMILIILSVGFIIFSRIDDWIKYRR